MGYNGTFEEEGDCPPKWFDTSEDMEHKDWLGLMVSFSCQFGWHFKEDYSEPTLTIRIEKMPYIKDRPHRPIFLSTNVSFKLNNVEIESTSLHSMTLLHVKDKTRELPFETTMEAPASLKGKAGSVEIIVKVQVDVFPSGHLASLDWEPEETVDFDRCKEDDIKTFIKRTDLAHLSDVKIKTKSQELDCHKFMLSLRSDVFRAMFDHDTKESQDNVLVIKDFDYITVSKMIDFIYDGHIEDYEDNLLLQIADKYEIKVLKQRCEKALGKALGDTNVVDMWVTADLCQASLLKQGSINYMIDRWYQREQFEGLKEAMKKYPRLIKDLVGHVPLKTIGSENLKHALNDPNLIDDILPILLDR